MEKNFKQLHDKIASTIPEFEKLASQVELLAANQAEVTLALRTFATGNTGVRDINGNKLKPYSEAYAKKRLKNSLQVDNKDLVFKKQGSVIESNIKVGADDGKPALGFLNEESSLIAGYQEEQNQTKIFQLNDKEREEVISKAQGFLINKYKEITSKWR